MPGGRHQRPGSLFQAWEGAGHAPLRWDWVKHAEGRQLQFQPLQPLQGVRQRAAWRDPLPLS